MRELYKNYLFEKHILVSESGAEQGNRFETLFSLANLFNIRIVEGEKLVQTSMIRYVAGQLGEMVPEPFYRGFPQSVRALSKDQLIFDQLLHYTRTYGLGDFSEAGHSLFEEQFARTAFQEHADIKEFLILTEEAATKELSELTEHLLTGTRPLSDEQYTLVKAFIMEYDYEVSDIASKNTAIKLLLDTRSSRFTDYIWMSDVIKLVDELNYRNYGSQNIKKLNLKNQDRKFITSILDRLFEEGRCDIRNCFERKKLWNGLLHHIHYQAKNESAEKFLAAMRGNENQSVFSEFEKAMTGKNIQHAVSVLKSGKGSAAVLRNLNYIISRCESEEEIQAVLDSLDTKNVIVLIQLLLQYSKYDPNQVLRVFTFTKYNQLKVHMETEEEGKHRKSLITKQQAKVIRERLLANLKEVLKGRLGKVYIESSMKKYALPIQENTSQGGFGVLTRGSRIPIGDCKKLRAFTYWEKVNDIDLSVFGIDEAGNQIEFSWRTMAGKQSKGITYSGDETSGYHGGSEYFDIDIKRFQEEYPDIRYLIFCDNVYSGIPFDKCFCKAGYMTRDLEDSGQVYEPKTVQSSYLVDCDSMFAYLFGIDLTTRDFIWLNMARNSGARVAGTTSMSFLTDYFHVTDVINVYSFFEMMAAELVEKPEEAEVVVTNKKVVCTEGAEVIREYDVEKMIALMNQ